MRSISSNGSNFLFQTVECTSMELQPRPLSWLRPWQSMARRQSSGMWKSCTFIQRGQGLTISQNMKVYYGDKHFKWSVLVKKKNVERRFMNRLTYEDWLMLYPHLLWIFHELKYKILITVLNSDPPPKKKLHLIRLELLKLLLICIWNKFLIKNCRNQDVWNINDIKKNYL